MSTVCFVRVWHGTLHYLENSLCSCTHGLSLTGAVLDLALPSERFSVGDTGTAFCPVYPMKSAACCALGWFIFRRDPHKKPPKGQVWGLCVGLVTHSSFLWCVKLRVDSIVVSGFFYLSRGGKNVKQIFRCQQHTVWCSAVRGCSFLSVFVTRLSTRSEVKYCQCSGKCVLCISALKSRSLFFSTLLLDRS